MSRDKGYHCSERMVSEWYVKLSLRRSVAFGRML